MFDKVKNVTCCLKNNAKSFVGSAVAVGGTLVSSVAVFAVEGTSTASGNSYNTLSTVITADAISGVLSEITNLLPIILPTVIAFMAFRKGWAWFKEQIMGA